MCVVAFLLRDITYPLLHRLGPFEALYTPSC